MDDGVSRIYVESPIFTEDDKNTFKFVNPDIDHFEDITERNINDSTARLLQSEKQRRPSIDPDRYEDVNESINSPSTPSSSAKHSRNQNVSSRIQGSAPPSIHAHEKSRSEQSFHQELRDEEVDELLLAERHLLQQKQGERSNVPHLDLIDSEDERGKPSRLLDLEINEGKILPYINKTVPDRAQHFKVNKQDDTGANNLREEQHDTDQIYMGQRDERISQKSASLRQYSRGSRDNEDENNRNDYNSKLVYQEANEISSDEHTQFRNERERPSNSSKTLSTWEARGWSDNGADENASATGKLRMRDEKRHNFMPSSVPVKNFIEENRNMVTHQPKKTYEQLYAKKINKHLNSGDSCDRTEGLEEASRNNHLPNTPPHSEGQNLYHPEYGTDGKSQNYAINYYQNGDAIDQHDFVRQLHSVPNANHKTSKYDSASGLQQEVVQRTHYSKPTAAETMWRLRAETLEKQQNWVRDKHLGHDALYGEKKSVLDPKRGSSNVKRVPHTEEINSQRSMRQGQHVSAHGTQQGRNDNHSKSFSQKEAESLSLYQQSYRPKGNINPLTVYDPVSNKHLKAMQTNQAQIVGGIKHSSESPRKNRVINTDAVTNGDGETIHHIITTDDGQKVSVDINLRILSPRTSSQYYPPHNYTTNQGMYSTGQPGIINKLHPSGHIQTVPVSYGQKMREAPVKQGKASKDTPSLNFPIQGSQYPAFNQAQGPNAYFDGGYVPGGFSYHGGTGTHANMTVPIIEDRNQYIYVRPNTKNVPTEMPNHISSGFQIPNQSHYPPPSMQQESFYVQAAQPVQTLNGQQEIFEFHPGLPVSPYKVLPPLSGNSTSQSEPTGLRSPKFHAGGSYLDRYRRTKNRQPGEYKEYTLSEYKKLQKELNYTPLGTLGPDLESEELREKREKAMRQQEYARNIKKRHLANIRSAREKDLEAIQSQEAPPITGDDLTKMVEVKDENLPNLTSADKREELKSENDGENHSRVISGEKQKGNAQNKRRLALEHAKHVRKPKVPQRSSAPTEGVSSQRSSFPLGGLNKEDNGKSAGAWTQETSADIGVDAEELLRLQKRHELEKNDVALLLHT